MTEMILSRFFNFLILIVSWNLVVECRIQQIKSTIYVVSGESVTLPCAVPGLDTYLKWRFQQNGSDFVQDAAQVFPGGIPSIFNQFDLPPGRSILINGQLTITTVQYKDEGFYWCEISSISTPTQSSDKIPLHVWVEPQEPLVTPIGNDTVLEFHDTPVARCKSNAGNPEATLGWYNGSQLLQTSAVPIVSKNAFSDFLFDVSLDLVLEYPTRFDHRRVFQCHVTHPAYKGEVKTLNYSVNVLYHPVNVRIWANLTSLIVFCGADSYPSSKFSWVLPGGIEVEDQSFVHMDDLYRISGNQFIYCTAANGIPDPTETRVLVEDLRYPDGRPVPTLLGLEWYIWAAIGGGVLLLIIIIIVSVCCYRKKKKKKSTGNNRYSSGRDSKRNNYSGPIVNASKVQHSQPSLFEFDSVRTPDGRESSIAMSETGYNKTGMQRATSLEHLLANKYGDEYGNRTTLVPTNRFGSQYNLYNTSSLNRRASREEIDQAVEQIEVLNKSWDHLAKSREHLNQSRDELRVRDLPPRYQSQDDVRHEDQDNYPYMDEASNRNNDSYPRNQNQHNNYQPSTSYNNQQQYDDQYDDRYDDQYNNQYNDQYSHENQYNQRNDSYNEFSEDDDQGYGYDRRGYQPSSMI